MRKELKPLIEDGIIYVPTITPEMSEILKPLIDKMSELLPDLVEAIKEASKRPDVFTRDELQGWLYAIVMNNMEGSEKDKVFADCVVEIIDRLDGFERYVKEKRREGEDGQ